MREFIKKCCVFSICVAGVSGILQLQPANAGIVLSAPPGSSPAVQAAVAGFDAACFGSGGTDLDSLCFSSNWSLYSTEELAQISPAHQQALGETLRQRLSELAGALIGPKGRTNAVRTAAREGRAPGFAFNGKPVAPKELQIAAATGGDAGWVAQNDGGGGLGGKLGAFLNLEYGMGEQDQTPSETGFDSDVIGVLAGVDYRLSDKFTAGVSFGYRRTDADFTGYGSSSEFNADNYTAALYASYYPTDAIFVDLFGSYGFGNFETERFFFPFNQTAKGDTDGTQFGLSATAGYQFFRGALTYGPYIQASWTRSEVDGYTETGSGLALDISDQDLTSVTSVLGLRLDYAFSTGAGVIVPTARFEWEHEFSNDDRVITAQFASDPGSFMNLPTQKPDRDYFNLGVGASMTFEGGVTAFVDFETLLGHEDLTNHKITAGARLEF